MESVLIKTCKNGTKIWEDKHHCCKCGGSGRVAFTYANGICFDCDGKGWYWVKRYEFTPEMIAKREAKEAKKAAERAAKAEEYRKEREAREAAARAEREAWEAKRRGHYYGEIGQKIEIPVTFIGAVSFDTVYGPMNIHRFDTEDGAHLVWKTSAEIGGAWGSKGYKIVDDGDKLVIRATIKAHKEYHGIDQTELTRVKLISGGHDPAPAKPIDLDEIFDLLDS